MTPLGTKQSSIDGIRRTDHDSYWFLAVGYFNVILPSFLPKVSNAENPDELKEELQKERLKNTFWARARSAKSQSTKAAKSPFVVSRSHAMSNERARKAIQWAKEDDGKVDPKTPAIQIAATVDRPKVPSQPLIGLSLLGNLDGIYRHAVYDPAGIKLHTLTTGSRQRPGAMLLFGYTFAGKLWLSLGYDQNGYEQTTVTRFWEGLQRGVTEFLE
jgi:hypothetical protein